MEKKINNDLAIVASHIPVGAIHDMLIVRNSRVCFLVYLRASPMSVGHR